MSNQSSSESSLPPSAQALIARANRAVIELHASAAVLPVNGSAREMQTAWRDLMQDLVAALSAQAAAPIQILDVLHAIMGSHGIASRAFEYEELVTQLIRWAADACRQSQKAAQEAPLRWFAQRLHPTDREMIQVRGFATRDEAENQTAAWRLENPVLNPYYWERPDQAAAAQEAREQQAFEKGRISAFQAVFDEVAPRYANAKEREAGSDYDEARADSYGHVLATLEGWLRNPMTDAARASPRPVEETNS